MYCATTYNMLCIIHYNSTRKLHDSLITPLMTDSLIFSIISPQILGSLQFPGFHGPFGGHEMHRQADTIFMMDWLFWPAPETVDPSFASDRSGGAKSWTMPRSCTGTTNLIILQARLEDHLRIWLCWWALSYNSLSHGGVPSNQVTASSSAGGSTVPWPTHAMTKLAANMSSLVP